MVEEMQRGEGREVYPLEQASREEGLLLVTYSLYCSQTVKQETPCALLSALCPCPTGQRGDSCGPFLLWNINDFSLPPRAGNRHQLAQPTQTAGCQPACPPASPRTTWEEAAPQAGFLALPVWLSEQAGEPYPAFSQCWQRGNGIPDQSDRR